jgi:hypothetical protein
MSAPNLSGNIELRDRAIIYSMPNNNGWQFPVYELRVVGEYTTVDGPADDYFFVFVTENQWFEASFYANGRDSFLSGLGTLLGHKLECGLTYSTSLMSRVLWPVHLQGKPMFDLVPETEGATILDKCWQKVFTSVSLHFTADVLNEK